MTYKLCKKFFENHYQCSNGLNLRDPTHPVRASEIFRINWVDLSKYVKVMPVGIYFIVPFQLIVILKSLVTIFHVKQLNEESESWIKRKSATNECLNPSLLESKFFENL